MIIGLSANFSLYNFNSSFIKVKSAIGSRPSIPEISTKWTKTLHLSICFKKSWPKPWPSLAPSISPGMSATINDLSLSIFTTPKFGSIVVKW